MDKKELFWQTYLNFERELLDFSKYVYISDADGKDQLKVFSPYICDFLVRVCIEIEAISKELYFNNGGQKPRGDTTLMFDTDCLKLVDIVYGSHKKVVLVTCALFNLVKEENLSFKPLKDAHKQKGTEWERSYQAVKHDRYSSISKGNLKSLLRAMGALYLLNIYYKSIKLATRYLEFGKIDFSFGSKLFSVKKPSTEFVIDVINNKKITNPLVADESLFILKYTDKCCKDIVRANQTSINNQIEYYSQQPEMSDPEFLEVIAKGREKEIANPQDKLIISWELCKFRLNKRIPSTLSFEKRRELFISSPEWRGQIRLQNKHLDEEELTPENIQKEIDQAGVMYGMELDQQFEAFRMQKAFNEGFCEIVLDNGKVNYPED